MDVLEFILARFNYWIVIVLMMTGLYIVFSRGNLVKTIIGLNIFQTSVFILYITMGKVAGGTAPILMGGHEEGEGEHGGGHDAHLPEAPTGPVGTYVPGETVEDIDSDGELHGTASAHTSPDHVDPLSPTEAADYVTGEAANSLEANIPGEAHTGLENVDGLHSLPSDVSNSLLEPMAPGAHPAADAASLTPIDPAIPEGEAVVDAAHHGVDAAHAVAEVIYSNPLPHVLILTAIVVGVATTAVGLAIAVRIREAYGTIEEDALEQMDNYAEFGQDMSERARS